MDCVCVCIGATQSTCSALGLPVAVKATVLPPTKSSMAALSLSRVPFGVLPSSTPSCRLRTRSIRSNFHFSLEFRGAICRGAECLLSSSADYLHNLPATWKSPFVKLPLHKWDKISVYCQQPESGKSVLSAWIFNPATKSSPSTVRLILWCLYWLSVILQKQVVESCRKSPLTSESFLFISPGFVSPHSLTLEIPFFWFPTYLTQCQHVLAFKC